jgi:hypothetical protein
VPASTVIAATGVLLQAGPAPAASLTGSRKSSTSTGMGSGPDSS